MDPSTRRSKCERRTHCLRHAADSSALRSAERMCRDFGTSTRLSAARAAGALRRALTCRAQRQSILKERGEGRRRTTRIEHRLNRLTLTRGGDRVVATTRFQGVGPLVGHAGRALARLAARLIDRLRTTALISRCADVAGQLWTELLQAEKRLVVPAAEREEQRDGASRPDCARAENHGASTCARAKNHRVSERASYPHRATMTRLP